MASLRARSSVLARVLTAVSVAAFVSFGVAPLARAADEDPITPKVVALETKVASHASAKDLDGLKADVTEAASLYTENAKKDPNRERILKVIGGVAKRNDEAGKAALAALGETKDADGAKYVKSLLRPVDGKTPAPPNLEAALEAAKQLPDDSLVDPLLAMVDDSKDIKIAQKAMESLATYSGLKRSREKILDRLVKTVMKSHSGPKRQNPENQANPEASQGQNSSQGSAQERWQTLSVALPSVLNQLTGKHEASTEAWNDLVSQNRGKLGALFDK